MNSYPDELKAPPRPVIGVIVLDEKPINASQQKSTGREAGDTGESEEVSFSPSSWNNFKPLSPLTQPFVAPATDEAAQCLIRNIPFRGLKAKPLSLDYFRLKPVKEKLPISAYETYKQKGDGDNGWTKRNFEEKISAVFLVLRLWKDPARSGSDPKQEQEEWKIHENNIIKEFDIIRFAS